ncbi:MAG: SUMF1/EgtB/PvdO family nonheme iron enzyme [Nitrospinae bacterium]|nr:SUMF1/EgtB/PvdO family nonheme iron enzyme [Nitrospinota bacterium]
MNRSAIWLILICAMLTLSFATAARADYEAGKRAWDAMRPAEALKEWRAATNAGDKRAMLALGRLYMRGLGAPQDYIEAHMWFNLASGRGELAGAKERDALAEKMTPRQIASAQERARSWRPVGGERKESSSSARSVREAQELLAALGYKPGPADGLWGARTLKAYGRFLRDAGLPPGDKLTLGGLRAMRTAARRQRPAPVAKAPPRRRVRPDALHRAVLAGDVGGVKAALKAGVDVNARDTRGWTALLHAAKEGHSQFIELLMKAGANPSIKGPKGETPVDLARKRYGTVEAARKKGEGPGVIALLEGKTWAKTVAEDDAAFKGVRTENTSAAYSAYLTSRPRGRHGKEALRLKAQRTREEADDAAFERAHIEGTSAAFAKYLSSYPKGRHAKAARRLKTGFDARMDDLAYGRALSLGTSAAFAGYLSSFPKGRHAKEALRLRMNAQAEEKADDAAFAQARKAGTSKAYAEYLSSRPGSRHAEEAQRLKAQSKAQEDADDAAFTQARKAGTSAAYTGYLSSRPGGRHAEEAQRLKTQAKTREDADDAAYAKAHKAGTSKAYAGYLSSYPKGRHSEQARRLMAQAKTREDADDATFAKARKAGTSKAYAGYLSSYPEGRHSEQARRLMAQAKAQEDSDDAAYAKANSIGTPAAYAEYMSSFPQGRHAEVAGRLKTQIEELKRKWPAGKELRDCPDCPEMVAYPAGSFMMGSPAEDKGGNADERPLHRVMIARPFAVGKYEVTRLEFEAFARASGRPASGNCRLHDSFSRKWKQGRDITWREPGFEQSESDPVVCVSWDDAKAYVKWLSEKTGQEYRLLSEAEWEYAARVGPKTKRNPLAEYFGASWEWTGQGKALNYPANCYGCVSFWGGERTAPIGLFPAIRFGLHDMRGNVREWVEDCWNSSHAGAPANGGARMDGDCSRRVVRGGSWFDEPGFLRAANREKNTAGNRDNIIGFRVARTLAP